MMNFSEWLESRIGYKRLYLESIAHLPQSDRDFLIRETPHTRIKEVPDPSFDFLKGIVELGFENFKISKKNKAMLSRAFCGKGVRIPGTSYRLRYHGFMNYTLVEPAEGDESELPDNWRQVVLVMDNADRLTWIGKLVRPDQIGKIYFDLYRDVGDGWELLQGENHGSN